MDRSEERQSDQQMFPPREHEVQHIAGRRTVINPATIVASAVEYEPGTIYLRLDDKRSPEFWLVVMVKLKS